MLLRPCHGLVGPLRAVHSIVSATLAQTSGTSDPRNIDDKRIAPNAKSAQGTSAYADNFAVVGGSLAAVEKRYWFAVDALANSRIVLHELVAPSQGPFIHVGLQLD